MLGEKSNTSKKDKMQDPAAVRVKGNECCN